MLAHEARGTGPAVLLIHAFPFDRTMWNAQLTLLESRFRVIAVDLPGFGQTAPEGPWTMDDAADACVSVLDSLGVPMAAAVGLSMGGYVAQAIAARHAGRLWALGLCDTRAAGDSEEQKRGRDAALELVRTQGKDPFVAVMPDKLLSPSAPAALRAEVLALAKKQPEEAIVHALAALRDRPDRRALLPSLRLPALCICGSADTTSPPAEMREMAAAIPGATYVELEGVGHLSNLEAPAAFDGAIGQFLDAHA
jgi:pimeloyl-ACP methyl ester carboxylesterase